MNIEEFRDYCLAFAGAEEKMPFLKISSVRDRDLLVFSVADKWFCFVYVEPPIFCDLKCDPDESAELQAQYEGITPGYHMNKKHWITVDFNSDVADEMIRELTSKSYNLIVKSLPKSKRPK